MKVRLSRQVQEALDSARPVVALESTVITHGLPHPHNLELARSVEEAVREGGALPATIAVIEGEPLVGASHEELQRLADSSPDKASLWNLAAIRAGRRDAGTTVAATLHIAALAGIEVFATGGIGGVHEQAFDESADLQALARYPLITVCAGPKSILDAAATLERLETLGVPVLGYRSRQLAGFHTPLTELPVAATVDDPEATAAAFTAHRELALAGGMLVSNPVSSGLSANELNGYLAEASAAARRAGIAGKEVTPFLLDRLATLSGGRTVTVNMRLLRENALLAGRIAVALQELNRSYTSLTGAFDD